MINNSSIPSRSMKAEKAKAYSHQTALRDARTERVELLHSLSWRLSVGFNLCFSLWRLKLRRRAFALDRKIFVLVSKIFYTLKVMSFQKIFMARRKFLEAWINNVREKVDEEFPLCWVRTILISNCFSRLENFSDSRRLENYDNVERKSHLRWWKVEAAESKQN